MEHFRFREFGPVFKFALFTGARRDEIKSALVQDVHLEDNVVLVRSLKTMTSAKNVFRPIGTHKELVPVLADRIKDRLPGDPLFPELTFHSKNWPYIQIRQACKALKIPYKRFHGIRHTTATYLLASGASVRDLMAQMGWTQIDTAQRYVHNAEMISNAALRLPFGGK